MIRSMTGFGAAEHVDDQVRVAVEVRTVNNRFLKSNLRLPEGLGAVEVTVERILREGITRGTVNVNLAVQPRGDAARVPINTEILTAYWRDLAALGQRLGDGGAVRLEALLALPGVVGSEAVILTGIEGLAGKIEKTVRQALAGLNAMRETEGKATAADMTAALDDMTRRMAAIEKRVPEVIVEYRKRLQDRVQEILTGIEIGPDDEVLAREVAFAAERSDINEELARLASHIAQFRECLAEQGPAGRKLEFLTQELGREVNTIGSKANDAEISRQVVEIKVDVDRLREQSANVE
jgi:uncharacterized protein (TIGR00255 family)